MKRVKSTNKEESAAMDEKTKKKIYILLPNKNIILYISYDKTLVKA
jgi:hypothetical protein